MGARTDIIMHINEIYYSTGVNFCPAWLSEINVADMIHNCYCKNGPNMKILASHYYPWDLDFPCIFSDLLLQLTKLKTAEK